MKGGGGRSLVKINQLKLIKTTWSVAAGGVRKGTDGWIFVAGKLITNRKNGGAPTLPCRVQNRLTTLNISRYIRFAAGRRCHAMWSSQFWSMYLCLIPCHVDDAEVIILLRTT